MTIPCFYHGDMLDHDTGRGHPERPDRLRAVRERLGESELSLDWREPSEVDREWLEAVHEDEYVDRLSSLRGESTVLDPDTRVSPGSIRAAYLAAGGTLEAIDSALSDDCEASFAAVRPPGHHAEPGEAMGFCLFDNIAVGAEYALETYDLDRVAIFDWDVHHGNGTQTAFYDREDILYASFHRSPFYPGTGTPGETGRGDGDGYTVNVTFPARAGDPDIEVASEQVLTPAVDAFDPDLLFVSAGYDAHSHDPVGDMEVSDAGFGRLTDDVLELAERTADGRLGFILEGGYSLDGLAGGVLETLRVCAGDQPEEVAGEPSSESLNRIQKTIEAHEAGPLELA